MDGGAEVVIVDLPVLDELELSFERVAKWIRDVGTVKRV